jgi:hypothetical protein
MDGRMVGIVGVLALLATAGCAKPRIVGKATFLNEPEGGAAAAAAPTPAAGVTLNFINLEGKIEESVTSAQTDAKGNYTSTILPPGKYTVEAMYPGYVIERTTVVLGKHGKKKAPFALKKIRETRGKSVKESQEENIPNPGEVKIKPPLE